MSSLSRGKKIASEAIPHRSRAPFFAWLRNKLLAVERQPPANVPESEWKQPDYQFAHRFPSTQATRSPEPPTIPGGVYHKLADNYYYDHDARRMVKPPQIVMQGGKAKQVEAGDNAVPAPVESGDQAHTPQLNIREAVVAHLRADASGALKGPSENFGLQLSAVTPGFGVQWERNISEEELTQREDAKLAMTERFDRYREPPRS